MKKTNRFKMLFFVPALCAALSVFLFLNRKTIQFPIPADAVPVDLPTYAGGNGGRTAMMFENVEKSVIVFGPKQELIYKLDAEPGKDNSFSNAKFVEIDEVDNLYILDTYFAGAFEENVERVLKYSPDGKYAGELYAYRYINEDYIITKGKISGMACFEGFLYLVRMEHDGFYLEKVPAGTPLETYGFLGEAEQILFLEYPNAFRDITYFHINVKQKRFVLTVKSGEIRQYNFDGSLVYRQEAEEGQTLPWTAVSDDHNNIIYADVLTGSLVHIDTGAGKKELLYAVSPENSPYYRINYVKGILFAASYDNVLQKSADDTIETLDFYFYPPSLIRFKIVLFICVILDGIALAGTLALLVYFLRKWTIGESLKRILLSTVCIGFGAVIAAVLIINEMGTLYRENTFTGLENVSRLVAASLVDTDVLDSLAFPSQYNNKDYLKLKDSLKNLFSRTQFEGQHVYQIIYVVRDNTVLVMHDLENSVGICYPYTDYEGSVYQEVMESGEYAHVGGTVDSEGSWMFVCGPVSDRDGNRVAIIETGYDRQVMERQTRSMIIQTTLIVIAAAIAFLLIIIEGILILDAYRKNKIDRKEKKAAPFRPEFLRAAVFFFVEAYKKRNLEKAEKKGPVFYPEILRAAVFFLFVTFNLATAMLPMYAANLYVPIFNLPRELVITFPFISDTIFAALALLIIPGLLERIGIKKIVFTAAILIALGNLLCFVAGNTIYLTIAYALTGFSGGAVLLSINTIIGAQNRIEDVNSGFAHFNASYLAGVNVGVVLGSVLAQFFPYRTVYLFSTMISIVLLFVIIFSIRSNALNHIYNVDIKVEKRKRTVIKFIMNPVVLAALFLLILPYVASLSFTSYFMPIYGIENGLRESNIGQLILLNGLFAILFGTSLCEYVSKKLPLTLVIALSLAVNAGAIYLFSLNMSLGMLVIVTVILAIVNIFALTNIQTYYASLYRNSRILPSRALGVYSAVENISMAVGPIVFSYIVAENIAWGMRLFTVILLAALFLFILISRLFGSHRGD
jgi:predicted MFS family arabinose efflux permease